MVCYDGSGVAAAKLAFALTLLGHDDVAVYDGGWSEWETAWTFLSTDSCRDLGPVASRSSAQNLGGPAASQRSQIRGRRRRDECSRVRFPIGQWPAPTR
jgi:hypothetical protein